MKVRLLPEAEADLESIGDFIARDNPKRALLFVAELRAQVNELATRAESFPLAGIPGHPDLRRRNYRHYGIYYGVNRMARWVDVHRVIHGSRDIPRLFAS